MNNSSIGHASSISEALAQVSLAEVTTKLIIFLSIIFGAVFGNLLVIISLFKFRKLRSNTNLFIASLAVTDLIVALAVMPFNLILSTLNRYWPFDAILCNWYNSNDVLFSTASLLHLCCISVDRYVAVFKPLEYEFKINRRRVIIILIFVWCASFLLSYIPIHTGIYADSVESHAPNTCEFRPNQAYGIISSTVSFWIPCILMSIIYAQIYRQALKQSSNLPMSVSISMEALQKNHLATSVENSVIKRTLLNVMRERTRRDRSTIRDEALKRELETSTSKYQGSRKEFFKNKENKAAKTLGILMGAFFLCWFPFFLWYSIVTICTKCTYPTIVVEILFWIGYLNSTLNPIIYAFYNKEFRRAFIQILGCNSRRIYDKKRSLRHFFKQ